jgi:hypothetical protein
MTLPARKDLVDLAIKEAGLSDFGDTWFFDNLDALIPAINNEARLSPEGIYGAQAMLTGALTARLRHKDLIKRHPEILEEKVNVAAVVTGLPRTGSTMLHRMLAAAPGMTAVRWYEAQNYTLLPGETRDDPSPRKDAAEGVLAYMLTKIPELMSIHPMSIDQPDEEVIIMGQLFSSSMNEASWYIPSYGRWLDTQDPMPGYGDLVEILQSLQWQDKSRKGRKWVLKTPGHLMALGAVRQTFPDAKIVMTHRDPVDTVPSYCSMEASLYKMGSNEITHKMVGDYWPARLADWLTRFLKVREQTEEGVFVDVFYPQQLADPIAQGDRVLRETGVDTNDAHRAGMGEWIEANKREHRAPHSYTMEDFGLTRAKINEMFKDYNAAYGDKL